MSFSKRVLLTTLFFSVSLYAQKIGVIVNNYKQVFEGAGTSIGLYIGHHFSQNQANQDKAIRMINEDLNVVYLQDYIDKYPEEDSSGYFDKRANYFKAAKAVRPESKVSLVFNNFPVNLCTPDSREKKHCELNVAHSSIYNEMANWYFQVLKGFKDRGVDVDIINVVNEPDYKKGRHYGYDNEKKGVALIIKNSVPALRKMLENSALNPDGIQMPRIMAPSCLATGATLNWVDYFRKEEPEAWDLIDIVATHQYNGGNDYNAIQKINSKLDGRLFYQSEMHAGRGDDIGQLEDILGKEHYTALSFASLFASTVNNGLHSWWYFENNCPGEFHKACLMQVSWNGTPIPYKQYYSFQMLTSTQPVNSHRIHRNLTDIGGNSVVTFRHKDERIAYVNVTNYDDKKKSVSIELKKNSGQVVGIQKIEGWVMDAQKNREQNIDIYYDETAASYILNYPPYSVNTLKIWFDNDDPGQPNNLTISSSSEIISSSEPLSSSEGTSSQESSSSLSSSDMHFSSSSEGTSSIALSSSETFFSSSDNVLVSSNTTLSSNSGTSSNTIILSSNIDPSLSSSSQTISSIRYNSVLKQGRTLYHTGGFLPDHARTYFSLSGKAFNGSAPAGVYFKFEK